MIWTLAVFACVGLSVAVLLGALVPGRVDLADAVAGYDAVRPAGNASTGQGGPGGRFIAAQSAFGRWVLAGLAARGRRLGARDADLEMVGRDPQVFAGRKALSAIYGALLPPAVAAIGASTGYPVPAEPVALATPALAAGFWLLPDLDLRRAASARRRELLHALGSYLDLVAMGLAGGRGAGEALAAAGRIGAGWAHILLADTVAGSRLAGRTPWAALGDLGTRLGVTELSDLAGALLLVADDGARVRTSIAARAASLRRRQLSDAEGRAGSADQSMHVAQVVLAFGFLLLILCPAAYQVLAF